MVSIKNASTGDSRKNFELRRCFDGSHTLVDAENAQAMHSWIGAMTEAESVYAGPAKIEGVLDHPERHVVLYDVGMGTGTNVVAVLDRIHGRPGARGRMEIFSFESKPEGLDTALANLDAFPHLRSQAEILRELAANRIARFKLADVEIEWRLLLGDFYAEMADAPPPTEVFFDFYSPNVVPELWSLTNFRRLRDKIGDRPARVFTYASATRVRLFLFAAGFFVGDGVPTAAKRETTIAATRLDLLTRPLPRAWLAKLERATSITGPEFAAARAAAAASAQWGH